MWERFAWLIASCRLIFDHDFQVARSSQRQRALKPFLKLLDCNYELSCGSECGFRLSHTFSPKGIIPGLTTNPVSRGWLPCTAFHAVRWLSKTVIAFRCTPVCRETQTQHASLVAAETPDNPSACHSWCISRLDRSVPGTLDIFRCY
jgi:hypothetical protein